jgi:hypothetical protein
MAKISVKQPYVITKQILGKICESFQSTVFTSYKGLKKCKAGQGSEITKGNNMSLATYIKLHFTWFMTLQINLDNNEGCLLNISFYIRVTLLHTSLCRLHYSNITSHITVQVTLQ